MTKTQKEIEIVEWLQRKALEVVVEKLENAQSWKEKKKAYKGFVAMAKYTKKELEKLAMK